MPFMNQPPGSLLSSQAVMTYGKAIHALRRYTQASLNQEPAWRVRGRELTSGYTSENGQGKVKR
jgi:hydrogenase small subunit